MRNWFITFNFLGILCFSTAIGAAQEQAPLAAKDVKLTSGYPWKKNIVTTCFWVGEGTCGYNSTTNYKSAWDSRWTKNYGGTDSPKRRVDSSTHPGATLPKNFAPTLNPFYVALPYNDIKYPKLSRKYVPWWNHQAWRKEPLESQCKGRWIMIEYKGRVAFAQWEDVGPFRYDHVRYVFGDERPKIHSKAGLDVSPAVRDYLGMKGLNKVNWRFVEDHEVPYGPWVKYGEQAVLYSVIKRDDKPSPSSHSTRASIDRSASSLPSSRGVDPIEHSSKPSRSDQG